MVVVKVQVKKLKQGNKEYHQYYITLPKQLIEALSISHGDSLNVFLERGDIILRRKE